MTEGNSKSKGQKVEPLLRNSNKSGAAGAKETSTKVLGHDVKNVTGRPEHSCKPSYVLKAVILKLKAV